MRARPSFDKARLPSRHVTEGVYAAPQRAFYYALGLEADDIHRPLVGVAVAWDGASGSADVPFAVAEAVASGVARGGATPRTFATAADDTTAGARLGRLLVGRELVADAVELTVRGHSYDALVGVGASSLGIAGLIMAACRLDIPAVIVPVVSAALGSEADAYAMAAVAEALALAPANAEPWESGEQLAALIGAGRSARALVTEAALRAAAARLAELDAEPDLLVHLAAIANECGIDLGLDDLAGVMAASPPYAGGGAGVGWISGGLAPDGALIDGPLADVRGALTVFDDEPAACAWLDEHGWPDGGALAVRFQGPVGAPGMRCLRDLAVAAERAAGHGTLIVTDGRIPRVRGVTTVSAVGPEAAAGGPLALVRTGDTIELAAAHRTLRLPSPVAGRTPATTQNAAGLPRSWAKYARTVGPARNGASTHPGARGETVRYADL